MNKKIILTSLAALLVGSASAHAAGYYTWDERYTYSRNMPQYYIAIRAGYAKLSGDFTNTIGKNGTDYVRVCDGSWETDGTCTGTYIGYGARENFPDGYDYLLDGRAFWDEYNVDSELDADTGRIALAVGKYLSSMKNVRFEVEFNKYMTFDHNDDRMYIGYMRESLDQGTTWTPKSTIDDEMVVSYTSEVDSSSFMINVYYDFINKHREAGDFIPFIGAGLGLSINRVSFALKDPQKEFENFIGTKYYDDTTNAYPVTETEEESLSWALMVGGSYVISNNTSLEVGLRYSNLGNATWAFDEYQSFFEAEDIIATDMFLGLKFNF